MRTVPAAVSFEHGEEDPVEFTAEDCEHMFDHDDDVDDRPDEEPASGIPLELYRPHGPNEPDLPQAELESLDSLADQHEISRLLGMKVEGRTTFEQCNEGVVNAFCPYMESETAPCDRSRSGCTAQQANSS